MRSPFRHIRLAVTATLLTVSALSMAGVSPSVVHAGTAPSISATGGDQVGAVTGKGFTPGGKVVVEIRLYNSVTKTWALESKVSVTALAGHFVCHTTVLGTICTWDPGGELSAWFVSQPGTVRVVAVDMSSATSSNTVTVTIYPIP